MRCPLALVLLLAVVVPSVRLAPQRSIDFLLGDEELQAVVKPIAAQPEVPPIAEQFDGDQQEREPPVVQATVDPIENDQQQQTEDSANDVTDEAPDEESVTDEPQQEERSEQPAVDGAEARDIATTSTPVVTTSSAGATTPLLDSSTTPSDSEKNNSAEEQLTTNPIVVQDTEEQNSTESSEDSNQLAQDVNSFIQDLANEVRAGQEGQQPQPTVDTKGPEYLTERSEGTTSLLPKAGVPVYPTVAPNVPDRQGDGPTSLESSEETDAQEQLKVDPNNDQQKTSGPSLTEDQFRSLIEKLRWYDQPRFAEFDQWQHQQFPQRSNWQQRDERQQHYQSHGSESFHGHGFHRTAWH
ncbi:uncharacterized protein LOC128271428 [Anopheles cruzii]|uniref:uncharacterized protein LOC128271428 n=1 Tax=Anopheles cruzii TaxID=68878 RepID=UPI0022EC87CC|nr:uncharacterized protein LOC128271428 [Anopheles cruzii]